MDSFLNKNKESRILGEAEALSLEEEKVNPSTPLEVATQAPRIYPVELEDHKPL